MARHLLRSFKRERLFFECMYRKYEYIFFSFSSLRLVRKRNVTLKHPDKTSGDKLCREPSSEKQLKAKGLWGLTWAPSPQVRWRRECPSHMKGVKGWQVRTQSWCEERCQICSMSKGCLWLMWQAPLLHDCGWIQSFACALALPPRLISAGCKSTLLPSAVPWLVCTRSD